MVILLLWLLNDMSCIYILYHQMIVEYWKMFGRGTCCLYASLLIFIKYSITDNTYEIRAFSYFPLKLFDTWFNRCGFDFDSLFSFSLFNISLLASVSIDSYFSVRFWNNSFFFVASMNWNFSLRLWSNFFFSVPSKDWWFCLRLRDNYFFFVGSIVEYLFWIYSTNLFLATGSMPSVTCFFLCFLTIFFPSFSLISQEQQINCISYSIVWHCCLFWVI